ncbi:MAG: Rid family hydrolase, partial [Flavobacteriaceae bacterium]
MKKIVKTPNAPAPIGPYNQAVWANDTLYISGQIGLDPQTMKLQDQSIIEETTQVMNN